MKVLILKLFSPVVLRLFLYFVAVKYGDGAGVYDFLTWNGTDWGTEFTSDVIAYVSIQNFKNSLDIKWPEEEMVEYQSKALSQDEIHFYSTDD